MGVSNLFVPADGRVFVAPSLIVYVDAHGYAPPVEFQRAVLKCPPMKSTAYLRQVSAAGLGAKA
jgi:hypothetical protein